MHVYASKVPCIRMTLYQYIKYLFMSFLLLRKIPLMKAFLYPAYLYLLYDRCTFTKTARFP